MTPENKEHFQGTYKLNKCVVIEAVAAAVNSPEVPQHDEAETVHNMSAENKLYFKAEKESIFLLLTGIGDACNTANEMWIAIERLQQGEIMKLQKFKTNCSGNLGKFTSRMENPCIRITPLFCKLMNE
ncbi:hypothetical protein Tco_0696692 [Tanacetum coccineum]